MLRSQMRKDLLARYEGPFDMARVVDLGWTRYIGTRPETEDYLFHHNEAAAPGRPAGGRVLGTARETGQAQAGRDLRQGSAAPRLTLLRRGRGPRLRLARLFSPPSRPHLFIQRRDPISPGRIRIQFSSGSTSSN